MAAEVCYYRMGYFREDQRTSGFSKLQKRLYMWLEISFY